MFKKAFPVKINSDKEILNPFQNVLDLLSYYKYLATIAPLEELMAFANGDSQDGIYPNILTRLELFMFQLAHYCSFPSALSNKQWWDVDKDCLEKFTQDEFFNDYWLMKECILHSRKV